MSWYQLMGCAFLTAMNDTSYFAVDDALVCRLKLLEICSSPPTVSTKALAGYLPLGLPTYQHHLCLLVGSCLMRYFSYLFICIKH